MRIAVTADGPGLDSAFVSVFGRCPSFVLVDTETMSCDAFANDASGASGGAGIQAAQAVVAKGVGAVVAGQVGPNAYRVLEADTVLVYLFAGDTVREAVEAFRSGQLKATEVATAPGHVGPGGGRGFGGRRGG